MGRFIVEFLFPALVLLTGWSQIVKPVIRSKPLFPLPRALIRGLLGREDTSKNLLESADARKRSAEIRYRAAEADAIAAKLEADALKLEEEAFKRRTE